MTEKIKNSGLLLNEEIKSATVLLIKENNEKILLSREEALDLAKKNNLDLVCVSPKTEPPICKLIDLQKLNYQKKKKAKKAKEVEQKELRIAFGIGANDLKTKLKKAFIWLEEKKNVKFIIKLSGIEEKKIVQQKHLFIINFFQEENMTLKVVKELHQERRNLSFTVCKQFGNNKEKRLNSEGEIKKDI